MYPRYNIPQQRQSMQTRRNNYTNRPNDDRFFGGGFLGPFLLGGIAGSLVGGRPNYGYPPPPPIIYYPPIQQPYYSTNNYYY